MGKRLTTEIFLERAKELHGDKYDYSKVIYIGSKDKVEIICPIHGSFHQKPNSHLMGEGCKKCSQANVSFLPKATREDFIKRASEIHNNFYDYTKSIFIKMITPLIITCPIHGDFKLAPSKHIGIRKSGCPHCLKEKGITKARSNTKEFISKASILHNNLYDYSKVEYNLSQEKVEIICTIHGSFYQSPSKHLHGRGCPHCKKERFDLDYIERYKDVPITFYVIQVEDLYKIGITVEENPLNRYKWEIDDISRLKVLASIRFNDVRDAYNLEQSLILKYKEFNYKGKHIFKKTRNTEIFTVNVYELYLEGIIDGK